MTASTVIATSPSPTGTKWWEYFGAIDSDIALLDSAQVVETLRGSPYLIRVNGFNSYSTGVHEIRMQNEKLQSTLLRGVTSQSVPLIFVCVEQGWLAVGPTWWRREHRVNQSDMPGQNVLMEGMCFVWHWTTRSSHSSLKMSGCRRSWRFQLMFVAVPFHGSQV
jgi:hypothetical protein